MHDPERVTGQQIPAVAGPAVPRDRLGKIHRHPDAVLVANAQVVLGPHLAFPRQGDVEGVGCTRILTDPDPSRQHLRQTETGRQEACCILPLKDRKRRREVPCRQRRVALR